MPKWLKITLIALAAGVGGLIIYAFPVIVFNINKETKPILKRDILQFRVIHLSDKCI